MPNLRFLLSKLGPLAKIKLIQNRNGFSTINSQKSCQRPTEIFLFSKYYCPVVFMTLPQLNSKTFLDLFPQFILIILEVLLVVTFFLLEKTHSNMEYVPFPIMV